MKTDLADLFDVILSSDKNPRTKILHIVAHSFSQAEKIAYTHMRSWEDCAAWSISSIHYSKSVITFD